MVAITGRLRLHARRRTRRRQGRRRAGSPTSFLIVVALDLAVPALLVVRRRVAEHLGRERLPAGARARSPLFHNISRLFNSSEVNVDFWGAMVNTFIVASAVTVSVVFFSALAGFAFAKLELPRRKALMVVIVLTMMVPVQLGVIPLYIEMIHFGWVSELKAVIGAEPRHRVRGLPDAPVHRAVGARTSWSTPRASTAATPGGSSGT